MPLATGVGYLYDDTHIRAATAAEAAAALTGSTLPAADGGALTNITEKAKALNAITNLVLTSGQSGMTVNNYGATGDIIVTLPAAASDLIFGVLVMDTTHKITLVTGAGDVIYWAGAEVSGTAVHVFSSDSYASIVVFSPRAGIWVVRGQPLGSWSIGS